MEFINNDDNGKAEEFIVEEKYSWDNMLEMFGGYKYFSKDHLLCLYHKVNNRPEEAEIYQRIIDEESQKVHRALRKMFTLEQIEEVNNQIKEN